MAIDERFDSEKGEVEKKLTDAQTRADEKVILKTLAEKGYNAGRDFMYFCEDVALKTPKALLYDLPKGLTKLAAATAFQAIPMWPNHRKRILGYFGGKGADESRYMFAGSVLQFFGEPAVAFLLLNYGVLNHSVPIKNAAVVLGVDVACKFFTGLNEASGLSGDESLFEEGVMNGWGNGIGFLVGGFLYMAGSTAKDLFDSAKGGYKQGVRKIAAKLQGSDNPQ